MRNVWHIYRREIGTFFTTPMAYVVMTLFTIIANVFFYVRTTQFVQEYANATLMAQMRGMPPDMNFNATELIVAFMFYQMGVVLLFLVPMLTMRLFAEENQMGTIELLLTCPVRDIEVILGKFLAALSVCAVVFAISIVYPLWLSFQTALETGPILTGYLGLLLLASAFVGIGIFFSSITENQIVAGALTFATLLFLWLLAALVQTNTVESGLTELLSSASIILRFQNFAQGVVNLGDALYYLSVTGFALFLTVNVLDSKVH